MEKAADVIDLFRNKLEEHYAMSANMARTCRKSASENGPITAMGTACPEHCLVQYAVA